MPPRRSRRKFHFAVWPPLKMPDEGVFTEAGYLFHHETPMPLNDSHKERLLQYGIQLAHYERFTPEEDQRIKRNWQSFAQQHGFIYEDARFYAGFVENLESLSISCLKPTQHPLLELSKNFAGRKLEHRSAVQVQRRICIIFDPHYIGYPSPLSLDTVLLANEMALEGKSKSEIALSLGISLNRLQHKLHNYARTLERRHLEVEEVARNPTILTENRLNREQYRRLFEAVLKRSSLSHANVAQFLQQASGGLCLEDFNWTSLIPAFPPLNAEGIRREWYAIIEELGRSFLPRLEFQNESEAWEAAVDEVMPCARFTLRDVIYYTKSLRKCIDKKTRVMRSEYIDKTKLRRKLSARGIVSQETFDLNECRIYKRIRIVLNTRNSEVFRQLRFPLTSREKLRILETCYRRLQSRFNDNELMTSLPPVSKQLLSVCIIERMRSIDPSWQPPLLFQRWIRSWHHIGLYTKHSTNDEIRNDAIDSHFLRETLFEDPMICLYGSSSTERQLYSHPQGMGEGAYNYEMSAPATSLAPTKPRAELMKTSSTTSRTRRHSLTSISPKERRPQSPSLHPSHSRKNNSRQERPSRGYHFKSSTALAPEEHGTPSNDYSYDIFGDVADETILAGNIEGTVNEYASDRSSPLQRQPSPLSTRLSLQLDTFLEEVEEDDSLRNLRIATPTKKAPPKELQPPGGEVVTPKEGWMKFLT